ncbi:MAG: rod shape-determining protein MreC [Patescibacteria group bacterium]|nr:rod shape-determining protein MreC [Patescibacteria group bacterium]
MMKKKFIIIIILVLIFVVFSQTNLSYKIRNVFYNVSSPIQKSLFAKGDRVSDFFAGFYKINYLQTENENLRQENQKLISQVFELKQMEQENKSLRKALDIGLANEFELKIARIIGKDISQDFILIDKGADHGIKQGMPVITCAKTICGRISQVFENFSKVELITSKKSSFDVLIQNNQDNFAEQEAEYISGVAKGNGNLSLRIDFVPLDKEIFEQDIVLTSALGKIFPELCLVGKIQKIQKNDIEPYQKAEISPFFDIKQNQKLFIITNF